MDIEDINKKIRRATVEEIERLTIGIESILENSASNNYSLTLDEVVRITQIAGQIHGALRTIKRFN